MKVSEQALFECRAAIVIASPMPINLAALNDLIALVEPSFRRVLDDDPDGANVWRRDRPMMLLQGACIGSLAALIAKFEDLNATEVGPAPLMYAFWLVKAGCDVVVERKADVKILTKYCSLVVAAQGAAIGFWSEVFQKRQ